MNKIIRLLVIFVTVIALDGVLMAYTVSAQLTFQQVVFTPQFGLHPADLRGTLPFDVPFLLQGNISAAVHEVHAKYIEFKRQADLELFNEFTAFENQSENEQLIAFRRRRDLERFAEFEGKSIDAQDAEFKKKSIAERFALVTGKLVDERRWEEKEIQPSWRRFEDTGIIAGQKDQDVKFTLLVPALEPNRYFHFTFSFRRNLDEQTIRNFRNQAWDLVDLFFQDLGHVKTSITFDQGEKLRLGLIDVILGQEAELLPAAREPELEEPSTQTSRDPWTENKPIPRPGSIFDKNADPYVVDRIFNKHLAAILEAQNSKYDGIRNFTYARDLASERLYSLTLNPIVEAMLRNLLRNATDNTILSVLEAYKDALTLLQLAPDKLADLAAGSDPGSSSPNLEMVWKPDDLNARISRLEGTIAKLDKLNQFVHEVRLTPALREVTSVEEELLIELNESIKKSENDLQATLNELIFIKESLEIRKKAIESYSNQLADQMRTDIMVLNTSVEKFNTRHKRYISLDTGLAWAPISDSIFGYAGANIYLRPVNKEAPLEGFQFLRRFALMIGTNMVGDLEKTGERTGLFADTKRVLLIGAGLRLTDSIRVTGGGVIFKAFDPNPLVDDLEIKTSPFISISIDWDVKRAVENFLVKPLLGRNTGNAE